MTKEELIAAEARLEKLWEEGRIKVPLHLSGGNEDRLLTFFQAVRPNDWVISTHRNHYHYLLKGGRFEDLEKAVTGSGNPGSMHTTDLALRFVSSCLVGCGAPLAVGLAQSIAMREGREWVWCFLGDGAVDQGMVYEAIVFAESKELPVTFVVEDNDRSVEASQKARGVSDSHVRRSMMSSGNVLWYRFRATKPHCGNGKFVSF